MLTIDIITLFPRMFSGPFSESIISKAREENLIEINIHNLRHWAVDKHGTVDSRPYGGGQGMILRPEPIFNAVKEIKEKYNSQKEIKNDKDLTVLLTPQGQLLNQEKAKELAKLDHLILICGHYEGIDERVRQNLVDMEISIGNYILTGGELPAMVVTDAVTRLVPGVLEKEVHHEESFEKLGTNQNKSIEYPQYTRPQTFQGMKVPEILLSGNHQEIKKWRRKKAVSRTKERRPELLKKSA